MERDELTGECFGRILGRRERAPLGQPPDAVARAALARMGRYRTRAPKGVFVYRSHEEANADQQKWLVEAVVTKKTDG